MKNKSISGRLGYGGPIKMSLLLNPQYLQIYISRISKLYSVFSSLQLDIGLSTKHETVKTT